MATKPRGSAYSAAELQKAIELHTADVNVTDSLSSDEDALLSAPAQTAATSAAQKLPAATAKQSRKARRKSRKSKNLMQDDAKSSTTHSTPASQAITDSSTAGPRIMNGDQVNNGLGDEVDELFEELIESAEQRSTTSAVNQGEPAVLGLQAVETEAAARLETATPTPMQQQEQPPQQMKRKRGRPSKADLAERAKQAFEHVASVVSTTKDRSALNPTPNAQPATSTAKRHKRLKARHRTATPEIEVNDSLFRSSEDIVPKSQDEPDDNSLFRSESPVSDSFTAPPPSNPRPDILHNLSAGSADESEDDIIDAPLRAMKVSAAKAQARDKGKARAISPDPREEMLEDTISSSAEEEEVQKSLVQELPKRKSAKRNKGKGREILPATQSSPLKGPPPRRSTRRASHSNGDPSSSTISQDPESSTSTRRKTAKRATKSKRAPASDRRVTPIASGSGTSKAQYTPSSSNRSDTMMPTPSASRPKWIRERLRTLTAIQHRNLLAHRTRSPERARGNPWSEDEEITLILALCDMYDEANLLGDLTAEDISKINYKRWRKIQEQHGVYGNLSDILRERSNVDLKDKARNIQKYREQLGLPVFNWYTYPHILVEEADDSLNAGHAAAEESADEQDELAADDEPEAEWQ